MGNDESSEVTWIVAIKFKLLDGSTTILGDVKLVPKLKRNVISLGLLDSSGYSYKSERGTLKIIKGALVIIRDKLVNGLYILKE